MRDYELKNASFLTEELENSIAVKRRVIEENIPLLNEIVEVIQHTLQQGNKLLLFGNGGSAADSQHIAAEFLSKFSFDRRAMPAIALTTDTSILTSIANDYAFEHIFARQIEALGNTGDLALGISTSGNSPNVIAAVTKAKEMELKTIGFTGQNGGLLKENVDICFQVPSNITARIQEVHITVAHAICGIVEKALCTQDSS